MADKIYSTSGVIPLLKLRGSDEFFVALVKRTKDAINSPDTHSGFFGGADSEDNNDPLKTASREFGEELIALTKDKAFSFYLKDILKDTTKTKINELYNSWKKRLKITDPLEFKNLGGIEDDLDFNDGEYLRKIYIVDIELDCTLDDLVLLDCEDCDGIILDRQVDVFELNTLVSWWHSDDKNLKSCASFKTGTRVDCAKIEKSKISSTLKFALDNSRITK